MTISLLGWLATAVFASSYFFRRPATLRKVQACAAFLWVSYGLAIKAAPVVVANIIVAAAALYSALGGTGISLRRASARPRR